jgi:hypothetical protein
VASLWIQGNNRSSVTPRISGAIFAVNNGICSASHVNIALSIEQEMGSDPLLGWSIPNTSGVENLDLRTSTQHKSSCRKRAENGVAITSYRLDLALRMLAVRGTHGVSRGRFHSDPPLIVFPCSIAIWPNSNKARLSRVEITNRTLYAQFWRTPGIYKLVDGNSFASGLKNINSSRYYWQISSPFGHHMDESTIGPSLWYRFSFVSEQPRDSVRI